MTSVSSKDDRKMRIKEQKKINDKSLKIINDEPGINQSFLNLPPENLSISHSDIEQGFNKYKKCLKFDKSTILSLIAIFIGLICITIEAIKLQKIFENSRDIDNIKKDMEILKNRYYEEDLLDELKAFEEQLNADEGGTLNSKIDDDDYDTYYDDDDDYKSNESNDYSNENNNTKIKKKKLIDQSNKKQDNPKHNKKKRFVSNESESRLIDDNKSLINKTIPNNNDDDDDNKFKKYHKNNKINKNRKKSQIVKRNLRSSRNIYAANYEADMMMFHHDDEHTGNGRAKHNEGIFKAWRSSDWMDNLGMNRYFTLSRDGKLTVHESGVYLVYAQIHYLDEHDENGFHMLVDGTPILQCMVYSPGTGHKSRSCYSSQVTYLKSGNRIVIKDVGPARYTLFQRDKSFFGLTKLGDVRQQQSTQLTWHSSPSSSSSSSSTPQNSGR